MTAMMKAAVFVDKGRIELADKPVPDVGPNDALVRITTTTICGTDVHILKGEYPVAKGLTVGHEPVGVIDKLGSAVQGYREGQRVIAGAICPNFNSYAAQDGAPAQDGSYLVARGLCGCHGASRQWLDSCASQVGSKWAITVWNRILFGFNASKTLRANICAWMKH